jgi:hypothetical protein
MFAPIKPARIYPSWLPSKCLSTRTPFIIPITQSGMSQRRLATPKSQERLIKRIDWYHSSLNLSIISISLATTKDLKKNS